MRELPGAQQGDQWLRNRIGRQTASEFWKVISRHKARSRKDESGEDRAARAASQPFLKERQNYIRQVSGERILRRAASRYVSRAMINGTAREPLAKSSYELLGYEELLNEMKEEQDSPSRQRECHDRNLARAHYCVAGGTMIEPANFVLHPIFNFSGASSDGRVGEVGMVETKALTREKHLLLLETKAVDLKYVLQMQQQMRCDDWSDVPIPGVSSWTPGPKCLRREWVDFFAWHPGLPDFRQRCYRDDALIAAMDRASEEFEVEVQKWLRENAPGVVVPEWDDSPAFSLAAPEPPSDWGYDHSKSFAENCSALFDSEGFVP